MKTLKIFILIVSGIFFAGCDGPTHEELRDESWPVDFQALVKLNCEAIELRKARFATADSVRLQLDLIRASMDSTSFEDYKIDFESRKTELLNKSNILADTIRLRMKNVMAQLSPPEKRVFNDSLQAELKRAGCE